MKKYFTILILCLTSSVFSENFDLGVKAGTISISDLDSDTSIGVFASYNLNEASKIKISYNTLSNEDSTGTTDTGMRVYQWTGSSIMTYAYGASADLDIDIDQLFVEYAVEFDVSKFIVSCGFGVGYSKVDGSIDMNYTTADPTLSLLNYLQANYAGAMDIDDYFTFGFTTTAEYPITDNLKIGIELNYLFAETEMTVEFINNSPNAINTYYSQQDVDMDQYGAFISLSYSL